MRGDACLRELRRRGVPTGWVVPPLILLAWRLGVEVSPPLYWPWPARLLLQAGPVSIMAFAILLGLDVFVRGDVLAAWWYADMAALAGVLAWLAYGLVLHVYRFRLQTMPQWQRL